MICVSIAESDLEQALVLAARYPFVELRLDAGDYSEEQVKRLVRTGTKSISTFRPGKHSPEYRLQALKTAIQAGTDYVDIEYEAPDEYRKELIREAVTNGCSVIISWHNFEGTPEKDELERILDRCYILGADVAKLACMISGKADMARLLTLYSLPGRKVVLGMGDKGSFSRLAALMLGAEFSFVSAGTGKETAPGQLELKEMEVFLQRFTHL